MHFLLNRSLLSEKKAAHPFPSDEPLFAYFIENTAKLRGMGNILSRANPPRSVAPEGLNGVEIGRLDRREKAEHNADAHGKHHGDEDRRDADGRRRAHDG